MASMIDQQRGTKEYTDSGRLPNVFLTELGRIFSRLSQSGLLSRCLLGLTQNQNESLNGLLWARLSKTAFCGRRKVKIGVCKTVCVANTGAARRQ